MSGGGAEDLNVDPVSVQLITTGLREAVAELKEIGNGTGAVLGKGLSDLSMTGMEAGHHGLSVDFEDFCERWEWGVRALVQDANAIAAKLGLAAGIVWEEDQYVQGTLKIAVNAGVGNPHASEDEIVQQDWGDVFTPDYLSPDYSRESFERTADEAGQTWKDTGRALVTEGNGGRQADQLNDLFGVDQEAFDRSVDDMFGPSPEERARQQQEQGGGGN
ncbi:MULTISPECIES: hypothetical protein [Streptomyces]|uniref:hypothetical protein n=1 Tax=Streptomyces TaxID=1883 RepID=UPI0008520B04|nr:MULTISPECIES: hypothetical protein [unclassified Streptomyces]MDQ0697136.1 hypothetical protein [Streptomyces sp. W4I9-2]MDX3486240.1 hypothetical protein [Streptomyces sp. ID05-18]